MLVKTGGFELEIRRNSLFLGINLGKRWRYQTFRTWAGTGLSASDWIDRARNDATAAEANQRG